MAPIPTSGVLYRTLWRWHFYAGLMCLPILAALAVSGAIYLFKPQLDAAASAPYQQLDYAQAEPVAAQIGAALARFPGSRLSSVALPRPREALAVNIVDGAVQRRVYVHPATLAVLGHTPVDALFVQQVKAFHGELLAGDVGAIVVELAGCWAIVLLISGLYLWWPRGRGWAGVLYPRFGRGSRVLMRDIHAVTGAYVALFALFLLISGLPWALVWGSAFKEVRALMAPATTMTWSVRGNTDDEHAEHAGHALAPPKISANNNLPSEAVWHAALAAPVARPALLKPVASSGQWQLSSDHQNRTLRTDFTFDSGGKLLEMNGFEGRPLIDRIIGIGISAHEGALFGTLNVIAGLLTCAAIVTLVISGAWLWWRRKPERALGAPPPMRGPVPRGLLVVVLGLALVLPLLALSLLVLWLLDWVVVRRLPTLRTWLGLRPAAE